MSAKNNPYGRPPESLVIVVDPIYFEKDDDGYDDWFNISDDKASHEIRQADYDRIRNAFLGMGADEVRDKMGSIVFECKGCNWNGKMSGSIFLLGDPQIRLLTDKNADLTKLREQALAKLTAEERMALGIPPTSTDPFCR